MAKRYPLPYIHYNVMSNDPLLTVEIIKGKGQGCIFNICNFSVKEDDIFYDFTLIKNNKKVSKSYLRKYSGSVLLGILERSLK